MMPLFLRLIITDKINAAANGVVEVYIIDEKIFIQNVFSIIKAYFHFWSLDPSSYFTVSYSPPQPYQLGVNQIFSWYNYELMD
jgi:hypothetical protein